MAAVPGSVVIVRRKKKTRPPGAFDCNAAKDFTTKETHGVFQLTVGSLGMGAKEFPSTNTCACPELRNQLNGSTKLK